jgi:signal transduction histidine kinase
LGQSLGDASAQIHAEWLVADARQQIDGLQRNQGRGLFDVGGHNGLAQLVAELEQARDRAMELANIKSQFLASMSHENRTPLNGVLGFAEIGQRNYQNPEKALGAFQKIVASGTRLLGVINDILDFSKIEAGKLSIEQTEVNLVEVVENTVELVRNRAEAKQLSLQINMAADLPQTCISDPLRIGQVLLNILNNAKDILVERNPPRKIVRIRIASQGERQVISIADTGGGVSASIVDKIFDPYFTTKGPGKGTGIGLFMSKMIIERNMNGSIMAKNIDGGAEFRVCAPLAREGDPS